MSQTCKACDAEISWPPTPSNAYTHYCYTCKTCSICGQMIRLEDLNFCLKYSITEFKHCACMTPELINQLENRTISISEREFDLLNAAHLMMKSNLDLSIDTNCKEAEILGITWFNQLPSLDDKYITLRRLETIAACFSLLLKKEPGSKTIRIHLNAESSERFATPSKQDIKYAKCLKCHQKFPELELSAHYSSCIGTPPKTKAAVAKKTRTKFEAAVDLCLKYAPTMTVGEAMTIQRMLFESQGLDVTFSPESELNQPIARTQ